MIFALILALTNFLLIYGLHQLHTAHERRIKALEVRKPEPEKRGGVAAAYEKPVVHGAKETTSLQIGGGKLNADQENHVYEWA